MENRGKFVEKSNDTVLPLKEAHVCLSVCSKREIFSVLLILLLLSLLLVVHCWSGALFLQLLLV